jgi:DNA replication protein DnaC
MLTRAKTTEFIVLDDFGVEYAKEGGLVDAFLDEIIWTREANCLPTIITTNLSVEALKARLPERLIDRLRGQWGAVYECPGRSLRHPSQRPGEPQQREPGSATTETIADVEAR